MTRRLDRMESVLDSRLGYVSVALEAVYHRHNVSAILRTCDCLGVHRADLVAGRFKAVRGAARGAERWLDVRLHQDPTSAIQSLQSAGYRVFCADISDDAYTPETVPIDQPLCLWMGAELTGVTDEALEAADGILTIPMHGFAQSLNVSVSAAMALRAITLRVRAQHGEDALLPEATRKQFWDAWMQREEHYGRAVRERSRLPTP